MPLTAALLESDSVYFDCAAEVEDLGFARLARMPGLAGLAAAGVVHRFDPGAIPGDLDGWVDGTVARLREEGWTPRFYLQHPLPSLETALAQRGFWRSEEVAMLDDVLGEGDAGAVTVEPLEGDRGWDRKRALHEACATGPDGHRMDADRWLALERRKADAGGLVPYLVTDAGDDVGTFSTLDFGPLLRLKNLVVHPRVRGSGVARRVVRTVLGRARAEGRQAVGCFALSRGPGAAVYRRCGFRAVARQAEWI